MSAAARFGGSVLSRLDAKLVQPGIAQAQRVALSLIDEDPDQPRRTFDNAEMHQLAASIRLVGVLQPVGVVQRDGGRYLLRWGARRIRASLMAGLADIPAVLVGTEQAGLEAQVIENQHRASNSNSELAAAVATLTKRGMPNAEIATVLALSDPQTLKHYRALLTVPPPLEPWVDKASARAVYELHKAWQKATPDGRDRIAEALASIDELTLAEARRIIESAQEPEPTRTNGTDPDPQEPPMTEPEAKPEPDPDAERVAKVRSWLANPARPRPRLTV